MGAEAAQLAQSVVGTDRNAVAATNGCARRNVAICGGQTAKSASLILSSAKVARTVTVLITGVAVVVGRGYCVSGRHFQSPIIATGIKKSFKLRASRWRAHNGSLLTFFFPHKRSH